MGRRRAPGAESVLGDALDSRGIVGAGKVRRDFLVEQRGFEPMAIEGGVAIVYEIDT